MHDNDVEQNRSVLPRWRSLPRTPIEELSSASGLSAGAVRTVGNQEALAWGSDRSAATASELIDFALVSGQFVQAQDAALWVLKRGDEIRERTRWAARRVLGITRAIEDGSEIENLRSNREALSKTIRGLKSRISDHPRDSIAATELARLYFLSGQNNKADEWLVRAAKQSPDNRYVLRSCAQFYSNIDESKKAIATILRSDAVKGDPWVQAAEVALSDHLGIAPRYGSSWIKYLLNSAKKDVKYSELAAGLASIEYKFGSKRQRIRKLLEISVNHPTENALAQALWVEDGANISVNAETAVYKTLLANEAQSRLNYQNENYKEATNFSLKWLSDQPFSADAARETMFMSSVHLDDHDTCIEVGNASLEFHRNDPVIINMLMYSYAMKNDLEGANDAFSRLEKFESDKQVKPFVMAGRGLIAFKFGKSEVGRSFYQKTIELCRAENRPSLALNALFYWTEQEAISGGLKIEQIDAVIGSIEHQISRLDGSIRSDTKKTWKSRKKNLVNIVNQGSLFEKRTLVRSDGSNLDLFYKKDSLPAYLKL